MAAPWWVNLTLNVPKVLDKKFLGLYDKLVDVGFEPTSAGVVAINVVHGDMEFAINYLRRNSIETLDILNFRATLKTHVEIKSEGRYA